MKASVQPRTRAEQLAQVNREVAATFARAPYSLPAEWYEPGTAERMADWIHRFVLDYPEE